MCQEHDGQHWVYIRFPWGSGQGEVTIAFKHASTTGIFDQYSYDNIQFMRVNP